MHFGMPTFVKLITAIIFLGSTISYAESTDSEAVSTEPVTKKQYYIVEVLLFRQLNEQGMREEHWSRPEDQVLNIRSENFNNESPALAEYNLTNRQFLPLGKGIAALSPEHYKLADSAANLRYSPDYRLLAHFGWTQRSLSKRNALPIKISADNVSDTLLPEGELKLYVSRFLHLQVELTSSRCEPITQNQELSQELTQTPATEAQTNDNAAMDNKLAQGANTQERSEKITETALNASNCINNVYRFKQYRKMRSKELHYLDNPVYGLLVYVTPFTVGGEKQKTSVQ